MLVALGLEDVKEEKNKNRHTDLFFNWIKMFVNLVKIHKWPKIFDRVVFKTPRRPSMGLHSILLSVLPCPPLLSEPWCTPKVYFMLSLKSPKFGQISSVQPLREDKSFSSCIDARNHQLRRAMRWTEPAPTLPCHRLHCRALGQQWSGPGRPWGVVPVLQHVQVFTSLQGDSPDHRGLRGLWGLHGIININVALWPKISPRNQAKAQAMYVLMNCRLHHGLRQQPGPLILTGPLEASQGMVVLQENPIQKADISSSQAFVGTQNQEWAGRFGGLIYFYINIGYCTLFPTQHCPVETISALTLTGHHHISGSASLYSACTVLSFSFPTLHHTFVLCSVVQHLAASSGALHREFKVYCIVFTSNYSGKMVWDNFCILSIIF